MNKKILSIEILFILSLVSVLSLTTVSATSDKIVLAQGLNGTVALQNQNQSIGEGNRNIATYENKDFGFKVDYPASWVLQEDNLHFNTIAAFQLIHTDIYDFSNTTLAEIDIRVFDNPRHFTPNNISINDINTRGRTIISTSNTTVGPLRAVQMVDYTLDGTTTKHMQVWTALPKNNLLVMIYYIVNPSLYDQYLPIMEHMLNSFQPIKAGKQT